MEKALRRYALPAGAIGGLYLLNRFFLSPLTGSRLLAWHGADLLAGGLMLCLLDLLLAAARRPALERPLPAAVFSLACGLFWEVVTPLYLPRSVGDPRDVAAVVLGGLAMALLWRRFPAVGSP